MMQAKEQYSKALSRQYPGLFVILLDQSDSMNQIEIQSGQSKASLVTTYVNRMIQRLIELASLDEFSGSRKNYAYISVIGYNDDAYPLLIQDLEPVAIPVLADNPLGTVPIVREFRDKDGNNPRRITENIPVWITPKAEGITDMTLAFEAAVSVVSNWLSSPPELISEEMGFQAPRSECFPPIVINITDAKMNGERDPEEAARRIRSLSTNYGHVLLYNCHITHEKVEPSIFPKNVEEVENRCHSRFAVNLFEMSSNIPETMRRNAERDMKIPISPGAHLFVYNANPDILFRFLRWTTLGRIG